MKRATWYYGTKGAADFESNVRNLARCKIDTLLFNCPDDRTMQALWRATESKGIALHLALGFRELFHDATGRPPPDAVLAKPDEYSARYPVKRVCWTSIKDAAPLAAWLEDFIRKHPYFKSINIDGLRYDNTLLDEEFPCECEACRKSRAPWLGHETLTAEDFRDPSLMHKEIERKVRVLTRLAKQLSTTIHRMGLTFSIAARAVYAGRDTEFAKLGWGYGPAVYEGQDWVGWSHDGLLDAIHLMNYSVNIARFERLARQHKAILAGSGVLACEAIGVSSSAGELSPDMLKREIELTRDIGMDGFTLFRWGHLSEEHMRVLENI